MRSKSVFTSALMGFLIRALARSRGESGFFMTQVQHNHSEKYNRKPLFDPQCNLCIENRKRWIIDHPKKNRQNEKNPSLC